MIILNRLLPQINDLIPIVDSRQTFSETPLIMDFYKLNQIDQLQILSDIVKQTILYQENPNPEFELNQLIGDDYTSAKIFVEYIKNLNLVKSINLVIVSNKKNIDDKDYFSSHFAVLVQGKDGKYYLVDSTPDIGYGIGIVTDLNKTDIYTKYITIDEKMNNVISNIRNDIYNIKNGYYMSSQIDNYNKFKNIFYNNWFNGILLQYYDCILKSNYEKLKTLIKREFNDIIYDIKKNESKNNIYKLNVIKNWYDKLLALNNSTDYSKKQIIAKNIMGELKDNTKLYFNNHSILLRHITPRLMWEKGLNVVIVKPSSYLVGESGLVINSMIKKNKNIITSYNCNLGEKNHLGLKPMAYFHPHGMKYEIQMYGPNKVILVKEKADVLNKRKHEIRNNVAQVIAGHYVNWYNGDRVMWDPNLNTNLVHSTDDATEASIHLLAGYPEYQVFTRFNYPNPILRKEKRK